MYATQLNSKMEERRIVEGVCRGDDDARYELYRLHAGRMLGIARRYLGDRAAAEDLLHDCFLKVFASMGKFTWRGEGSLRVWLDRVMVNMALDELRRNGRSRCVPLDDRLPEPAAEPDADPDEVRRIPRGKLMELVAGLPDGYRTVFNLYCVEGLSHREIAGQLGINEHSSASQLSRAKAMLAKKIKEYVGTKA